ncbi:MAG: hypothetical protein LBQ60_03225 [Bacteroidales bacterium]|jgi:hypothetical protein|nr:hypothetical protein [Bacteroidales bacterium]
MKNLFKYGIQQSLSKYFLMTCVLAITCMASCDNMKDNYEEYIEGGEIIYPGKADSIEVHPGKNRVELQWVLKSDPSITSAMIYWNNKEKSREVPILRTPGTADTIKVLLEDMEEQTYTFEVYTFDRDKNKSVASEVIGAVYGDKYRSTLLNRAIRKLDLTEEGDIEIIWESPDNGTIAEELIYTDTNGKKDTVSFIASMDTILLKNFNFSENIWLSTVFLPDSLAIDTFKVAFQQIALNVVETPAEVVRSGFSVKNLPGDKNEPNATANSLSQIWTNAYNTDGTPFISKAWALTACNDLWTFPYWFTIDMGQAYDLSSFTLWQRGATHLYVNNNPKKFEIWGALEVDENYNPAENGNVFDSNWILLESCEIIKPAQASLYATEAAKGHQFDLRVNGETKKVRYLRIKMIDIWAEDSPSSVCTVVKKRTYVNIASIRLDAVQRVVQLQ